MPTHDHGGWRKQLSLRAVFVIGIVASLASDTSGPGSVSETEILDLRVGEDPIVVDVVVQYSNENAHSAQLSATLITSNAQRAGAMTVTLDGDDGQTVTGITEAIGDGAQARADVVFNTCDADECLVVSTVTLTSSSPITTSTQLFVTATINLIDTENDAPQPELRVDAVPTTTSR